MALPCRNQRLYHILSLHLFDETVRVKADGYLLRVILNAEVSHPENPKFALEKYLLCAIYSLNQVKKENFGF